MANQSEGIKRFSWLTLARAGVTAAFFFWIYMIWNSTAELNEKLNAAADRTSAIHTLQIEYKNEIQEWKNVLLRSNSRDTLDKNWRTFEAQYQKVAAAAQVIIAQNDVRTINDRMNFFVEGHADVNENLTAKARNQIEQSLLVLGFIALLVVWMPKW